MPTSKHRKSASAAKRKSANARSAAGAAAGQHEDSGAGKRMPRSNKREGWLRIGLFFLLSFLMFFVYKYSWAVTLLSLAGMYALVTGAYKLIYNPKPKRK